MTERTEAELLAKVDMLAAMEEGRHHETCNKILHRCYIIIGILGLGVILQGVFLYENAKYNSEYESLRKGQVSAHRSIYVADHVGEINAATGIPIGPKGYVGRAIRLVEMPHFSWDWQFRHPLNPGRTFRDFAEGSEHPFAKELKRLLDKQNKKHMKADDET